MVTLPKEVTIEKIPTGNRYIVQQTQIIEPTGNTCDTCGLEFWYHSDNPSQLFTLGFMYQGVPIVSPHWWPCAEGWD